MIGPERKITTLRDYFAPLGDPDEGEFLRDVFMHQLDAARLAAYAERLAPLDPRRAEFLRLECALAHPGAAAEPTAAQRARYRELLAELSNDYAGWLAMVRTATPVRNCGVAPTASPQVRFRFACPNVWQALAPTDAADVRYCDDCRQRVYYCGNVADAERHARAGDCIAVPAGLSEAADREAFDGMHLGRPDFDQLWAERLFPDSPTRRRE